MLVTEVVRPALVTVTDNDNHVICSALQVPVVLAYAMTVHRSQGMTLSAVVLHTEFIFAEGQLYVGLSRVSEFGQQRTTGVIQIRTRLQCKAVIGFYNSGKIVWNVVDNGPRPL